MNAIHIQLHGGFFALIDAADQDIVSGYKWRVNSNGYAVAYAGGGRSAQKTVLMHRLIASTPEGYVTDHIDGNKLNNCRSNLRICTQQENCKNTTGRQGGHSKFKGVTWFTTNRHKKGYWKAQLASKHIGYFESEEDAARAYDKVAIEKFGEFARTNFPREVLK